MTGTTLKAILAAGVFSLTGHASLISLTNDFSIGNGNPNGQWAYQDNTTNLSLETPLNNGNALYPAISNGYWGVGNDLNTNAPDLFKAQVNGSSAGQTNNDFLAGDIVGHSPNDGSTLFERWTAPSAGTITNLALLVWYAHSSVTRSNDFALFDTSAMLTSGTVSTTTNPNRGSAATYNNVAGFTVAAGDVISLGLTKSAGQAAGSLAGESLNFTFTPTVSGVPEPATIWLFAAALALCATRGLFKTGAFFHRSRGDFH